MTELELKARKAALEHALVDARLSTKVGTVQDLMLNANMYLEFLMPKAHRLNSVPGNAMSDAIDLLHRNGLVIHTEAGTLIARRPEPQEPFDARLS